MWKKVRLLLVILSVALNVAFAAAWLRYGLPTHLRRTELHAHAGARGKVSCALHRRLGVSEKQWREIEVHFVEFRKESRQICRKITKARQEMIELMTSPNPDREAIRAKQEEILDGQRKIQDLVINQLLREKHVLTHEQQKKLFDLIRSRSGCAGDAGMMDIGPRETPPVREPCEGENNHQERR